MLSEKVASFSNELLMNVEIIKKLDLIYAKQNMPVKSRQLSHNK